MIDRYVLVPGDMRYIQKGENTSGLVVWCRLDDLIAAGALVPVPVGEPCVWHHHEGLALYDDGKPVIISEGQYMSATTDSHRYPCNNEIVQPVRLLTVDEWMEGGA